LWVRRASVRQTNVFRTDEFLSVNQVDNGNSDILNTERKGGRGRVAWRWSGMCASPQPLRTGRCSAARWSRRESGSQPATSHSTWNHRRQARPVGRADAGHLQSPYSADQHCHGLEYTAHTKPSGSESGRVPGRHSSPGSPLSPTRISICEGSAFHLDRAAKGLIVPAKAPFVSINR